MKKLKELYEGDRPREKLLSRGAEALKDHELMAVLLGRGVRGKDVLRLSKELVELLREGVDDLEIDKLSSIHGVGEAKAAQILAALELSRRFLIREKAVIRSAEDVWKELKEYHGRKQEYFLALTLDGASHLIEKRVISVGTLNQSLVHPREVFADAIADRAAGIVIAHNHPSGQCFPSAQDRRVTQRLAEAGRLLGIELLDHVILTRDGWYSFSEEGEL
ncbi:DNA repair protein RadC [Nitratifractor sp.]|uniref:RadC family protein n=1 Tax=Nitratifractor sp. TaxID=2268144 RepID=UPI0025FB4CC6|nr:DNA repair protein RadC [Nitratifractor sp.]